MLRCSKSSWFAVFWDLTVMQKKVASEETLLAVWENEAALTGHVVWEHITWRCVGGKRIAALWTHSDDCCAVLLLHDVTIICCEIVAFLNAFCLVSIRNYLFSSGLFLPNPCNLTLKFVKFIFVGIIFQHMLGKVKGVQICRHCLKNLWASVSGVYAHLNWN